MLDTDTGEVIEKTLEHEGDEVREFYSALPGPVLVGIEATGSMPWFLKLMEELKIECRVGHPAKVRAAEPRKQKHDRRDARHYCMRGRGRSHSSSSPRCVEAEPTCQELQPAKQAELFPRCLSSGNARAEGRHFCPPFGRAFSRESVARRHRFAPIRKGARCGWRPPREWPAISRDEDAGS